MGVISKYNFKRVIQNCSLSTHCEISLMCMPHISFDEKSTSVQVLAWFRQARSHYLTQCWHRSMSPYGILRPRPQWVKTQVEAIPNLYQLYGTKHINGKYLTKLYVRTRENEAGGLWSLTDILEVEWNTLDVIPLWFKFDNSPPVQVHIKIKGWNPGFK